MSSTKGACVAGFVQVRHDHMQFFGLTGGTAEHSEDEPASVPATHYSYHRM